MTQQIAMTTPVEEENIPHCCHYWVIQPATGPVSQGICQACGEVREFKNYVEASTWGDDRSANRSSAEKQSVVAHTVADHMEAEVEE